MVQAGHSDTSGNGAVSNNRRTFIKTIGGSTLVGTTSLLAGCSGDSGETETPGNGGTPDGTEGDETETPTGEIQRGGDLVLAAAFNVTGIQGNLHGTMSRLHGALSSNMSYCFGNRLVDVTREGEIIPSLAEEWNISDDGLEWTFKLREGVQFHGPYGEMTADDVVRSFREMFNPDNTARNYESFEGSFVGEGVDHSYEEAVQKTGEYEVTFYAERYDSSALAYFAFPAQYIVPEQAYEDHGDDLGKVPDPGIFGTGPFEFAEGEIQSHYTFEAFDDYWEEDLPYVDSVRFDVYTEQEPRYTALSTGNAHIADSLPSHRVSEMENDSNLNPIVTPSTRLLRLAPNYTYSEPGQSLEFRQGLAELFNYVPINASVAGGLADINGTWVPTWHELYDEEYVIDQDPKAMNREAALEKFREAGFEPPLDDPIKIVTEQEEERDVTAIQIMGQQMQEVGFNPTLSPELYESGASEWNWESSAENPTEPPEGDDFLLYDLDTPTLDPFFFLARIHYPGQFYNRSHYSGAKELQDIAMNTVDAEEKLAAWEDVLAKFKEDLAVLPMMWYPLIMGQRSNVHGFEADFVNSYRFKDVWIEQ